jgi:prolycopene isomerase
MDTRFDVIVVGAGNADLSRRPRPRQRTQHIAAGKTQFPGARHGFCRGRFEFEPSLHELASVGTAESPDTVYKIFEDLARRWTGATSTTCSARSQRRGGYDVTLKSGVETFCDSMERAVPAAGTAYVRCSILSKSVATLWRTSRR